MPTPTPRLLARKAPEMAELLRELQDAGLAKTNDIKQRAERLLKELEG